MTQRTDRIDELLRQEIGDLLERDVADPAIGFVTVTRVETSPDLAHARVWVSLIGQRGERRASLAALRRAMPYIRHQLSGRVRLRRIPDLHVELDETAERGTRVLQLLHELEEGRSPEELAPPGESLPTPVARIRPTDEAEQPTTEPSDDQPRRPRSRGSRQPGGGRQSRHQGADRRHRR